MEKRTAFIIFNKKNKTFATSSGFVKDFADCRIYKLQHHALNSVNTKHSKIKDDLAVIPIELTFDPYSEFSAIMGVYDVT